MPARFPLDLSLLRHLIEVQQLQQRIVAERLGCHVSTIERACRAHGLRTQRTGPRSGEGHPNWKGGRLLVGGYLYLYRPEHPLATRGGYVLEHRLVAEAKLGRPLTRDEVVHHRNGVRADNRPENLEVFQTNAEHLKAELTGRVPNWTAEGLERIREGVRRSRTTRSSKASGVREPAPATARPKTKVARKARQAS